MNVSAILSQPLLALSRRLLWAALAIVVLMGACGAAHTAEAVYTGPGASQSEAMACIQASTSGQDDAGTDGEAALADHLACGCHVAALHCPNIWFSLGQVSQARFEAAGHPASRPVLSSPPAEPPRT